MQAWEHAWQACGMRGMGVCMHGHRHEERHGGMLGYKVQFPPGQGAHPIRGKVQGTKVNCIRGIQREMYRACSQLQLDI
jgi:hypothetical protein